MRIRFTKMQGAGNDFVVLDETKSLLGLGAAQYRWLADRHFGVGADQVLSVRGSPGAGVDFEYVIPTPTAARWSSAATARAASCAMSSTRAWRARTGCACKPSPA
jgi:hypothetical protein